MKILAVVPARGGSKGVPLKNLRPLGGKPLITHTGVVLSTLGWVDQKVVSSDHAMILKTAVEAGLAAPFTRPEELSGDRISDLEVLTHALTTMEALDKTTYDIVLMLQPTCPLRRPEHVTACVDRLIEGGFDSVWTVTETDSKGHPLKQLVLENGSMRLYDPAGSKIIARQQLTPVYHRNGAAYAITRECLITQKSIMGAKASAVVIEDELVNIDTVEDFERAEAVLRLSVGAQPAAPSVKAAMSGPAPAGDPASEIQHGIGKRTFVVDVDGLLAELVPGNDYSKSRPLKENVAKLQKLYDAGHKIVLFTARGSGSGRDWSEATRKQMKEWGIPHHDLRFGKPAADWYIDDRLISLDDAVKLEVSSENSK
ncbi:MAG: hypothetical protein AB7F75_03295 [Planctomycetota bacterium]